MGEHKRKIEAVLAGPCPCGSGRASRACCYDGTRWHKPAAILGLKALPKTSSLAKCYMRALESCDATISGEHIISEVVIRVLMGDGDFSVSGFPWLEEGEEKIIGPQSLTAKVLCQKHNSALHPLDDAAGSFFSTLKSSLEKGTGRQHALMSGHDLERWLLKTAKAAAVSRSFARGREQLSGVFAHDDLILDMLDRHDAWPEGSGLYCTMTTGDLATNHSRFQFQPLTNARDEVEGMALNILGISFVLLLAPMDMEKYPFLRGAKYRPARIVISVPGKAAHWLTMSWDDEKRHEELTMTFLRSVPRQSGTANK